MYKKNYTSPRVEVSRIWLDDSIAVGSAKIKVGDGSNYSPEIDDWDDSTPNHDYQVDI